MNICPVIIAGGVGSRLWPVSRAAFPKQFHALHGNSTMLQQTFSRLSNLTYKSSFVVCNEEHRFFVSSQLKEIDNNSSIILEPVGRNSAPAIALAALCAKDDPLLLILSADHIINDENILIDAVNEAAAIASSGKIVTFGIVPDHPNNGYGYIKKGHKIENIDAYEVKEFVEKPSKENAKSYVKSNDYLWNSGMFLIKASTYLNELEKHRNDIFTLCSNAIENSYEDKEFKFIRVDERSFKECPSDSIDYAILEKAQDIHVFPLNCGWSDVGTWSSLWRSKEKDSSGNFVSGDINLIDTRNSLIFSESNLVSTIGIQNLIVVSTKDAILIADRNNEDGIKSLVDELKNNNRTEWEFHREVHRPWGKYDSVDNGDNYQVKKLTVNPGAKLSVQMHYHRSEHWVVVSGKARVHYGETSIDIGVNESTYHDKEVVHALENRETVPLELIEVQVGDYLGEDDIVRFDDIYDRT